MYKVKGLNWNGVSRKMNGLNLLTSHNGPKSNQIKVKIAKKLKLKK
jgi:hypothetical protein